MSALLARHGWKSYLGAAIVGITTFLHQLGEINDGTEQMIIQYGIALFGLGLAHKLVKLTNSK